ncbi:MAG: peptide ABC transporter substrate-binding protein [Proteobacteria bacterium]|nr:peptide ABC transporter substrate-binding protein [Pseudomonadota bacterium]
MHPSTPGFRLSRRRLLVTTAALGASSLVTARPLFAASKPTPSGQAIIGFSQEPTVFDPRLAHIEVDDGVYMALFSPLWAVDPKGNLLPRLAAEIPTTANGGISADGLTWSIKLRPGVTWHDGTPFTSDDVKFSIESVVAPGFPAYSRTGHELVENIQTPAPDRITWTMKKPFAPYMSILAWFFIVPKHALEGQSPLGETFVQHPIGTGPFKWKERVSGDHITLTANESYFGDGPLLSRVVYKYIPDLTVLYTQFRTGDIDYIGLQGISADHYAEAKKLADRNIVNAPEAFIECFYFNLGLPQFQDKAVRHALYMAFDKDSIIQQLYYGLPTPTESYLPQQSWAYNPNLPKHVYDLDRAKQMLDAAGWKPGAGGVREKNGVKLSFTNSTTAGNHLREQVQQLLQQDFQQIGVNMTIKNLPPAVMWGDYWIKSHFETAIVGLDFMVGPDPDASDYLSSASIAAKTGSGQNTMQYSNPEVDQLLLQGATTIDQQKRIPIYQKLQAVLRDDLPFLPQQQYAEIEGTKSKLDGFIPNINVRTNTWNLETWHWAS